MARRGQLDDSSLRPGWTTGACATAAATAAHEALLTGEFPDPVEIELPQDRRPSFALTLEQLTDGVAMAAVTKDAGDDPDITHGALVRAWVRPGPRGSGVRFLGGSGVGTVTLPGLPLPVGEPAINPAPRAMITANLSAVARRHGVPLDLEVTIGVDDGEALARHTWNPRVPVWTRGPVEGAAGGFPEPTQSELLGSQGRCLARRTSPTVSTPLAAPTRPPSAPRIVASMRNCAVMWLLCAPMARRTPISGVRSMTATKLNTPEKAIPHPGWCG